jgi:hypothetical protein
LNNNDNKKREAMLEKRLSKMPRKYFEEAKMLEERWEPNVVPKTIKNLKELSEWVEEKLPTVIFIERDNELLKIREFGEKGFRYFTYRGIPIIYY